MTWIGEAFQVNKIDFAAKLFGGGAANSAGNGRLANAAGAKQCYEPPISKLVLNLADHRFAVNHHMRSRREPALLSGPVVPALRTACERDDGADERVAPSLDVCDVAVAELAVTKRFADRGHVNSEAPLLDGYVRPDVVDQLLLRDDLTWALGKIDQNIQCPIPERKHLTVALEHPLANRKFERAKPQPPMNYGAKHVSAK
jgi:hypothetical protein